MTQQGLDRFSVPDLTPGQNAFGIKSGRVVKIHYENHSVDIFLNDGSLLQYVPMLEDWGGSDYGDWWLPQLPDTVTGNQSVLDVHGILPTKTRDTMALIAFIEGHGTMPVCIGFYYPDTSQMMFGNLQKFTRFVGDTFSAVAINGTHWLAFDQDGTGISINSNDYANPPIVVETDYDKKSKPKGGLRSLTLYHASGSFIHLDGATGNVQISSKSSMFIDADGPLSISGSPLTLSGLVGIIL